jgi:hypothetical protein
MIEGESVQRRLVMMKQINKENLTRSECVSVSVSCETYSLTDVNSQRDDDDAGLYYL